MTVLLGLLAALAVLGAALGFHLLGARCAGRMGKAPGEALAAGSLAATLVLVALARWHPARYSEAVALSPLVYLEFCYFTPTVALFLGLAGKRVPRPETGRAVAALSAVVALYAGLHVFLTGLATEQTGLSASPPPAAVQAQTTNWSCGAASCVTLLKAHGIASTEREMGELCLALPYRGTTLPRFVRGLTLKLRKEGSPLRVVARDRVTVSELDTLPLPCLLGIKGGLLVGHAVVLLDRTKDGAYRVGDPLGGGRVNLVTRDELAGMLGGDAVALVR